MPFVNRKVKVICSYNGTTVSKTNLSRHRKSCTRGTETCLQCPNFYCQTQKELNHHIGTKHAVSYPDGRTKCSSCEKEFPGYNSLQKHKKSEHGKRSRIQDVKVDLDLFISAHRDQGLREELTTCKHFLVDSELVRGRQHVFNFASNRINPSFLKVKLQHVYENLQFAPKFNMLHGFVLRNIEDGKYRYFYAHENNLFLERSQ